jgi:hypothetical protein
LTDARDKKDARPVDSKPDDPQSAAGTAPDTQADKPRALARVTTLFDEREDRIRLSGEIDDGSTCVIWITQRLLLRLLPRLFEWLEREVPDVMAGSAIQEFRQQTAAAALEHQAPVQTDAQAQSWLLTSVDVSTRRQGIRLLFKGDADDQRISLGLAGRPLRQWLGVLHGQCKRGGWPMEVWPSWMETTEPAATPGRGAMMH